MTAFLIPLVAPTIISYLGDMFSNLMAPDSENQQEDQYYDDTYDGGYDFDEL